MDERPLDIRPGQQITARWMNAAKNSNPRRIIGGVGILVKEEGGSVIIEAQRQPQPTNAPVLIAWMLVTAIGNDSLTCKRYDGSSTSGDAITVAKPPELRHAAAWYAGATGIATVDAQTVTASAAGEDDETWKVTPDYIVDVTEILAYRPPGGTTVSGADWIDLNIGGRAWAVEA